MNKKIVLFLLCWILLLSGCFNSGVKNVQPVAQFSSSQSVSSVGEEIIFDASASSDVEDGQNLLARWDFDGDGRWEIDYGDSKKTIDRVSHTYYLPGKYHVRLEVKDTKQATDKLSKEITIKDHTELMSLEGIVLESRGGVGIANASVHLSKDDQEMKITTDDQGRFAFQVISGIYQLVVTKDGYSTSKVQDLYVGKNLEFELEVPLIKEFYSAWPNEPPIMEIDISPEISSGQAFSGQTFSGEISLKVSGHSDLGINIIEISFGHQSYSPDLDFLAQDSCQTTFDTTQLPNGWNYIKISMYDANYNFVQTFLPIRIENSASEAKITQPEIGMLFAMTFGKSLKLMAEDELSAIERQINQKIEFDLWKMKEELLDVTRTIFVEVIWSEIAEAMGYKIYRRLASETTSRLIATTVHTSFTDLSSALVPGEKVFYQVSAYTETKESDLSSPVYTIPLKRFNVMLEAPTHNRVITSTKPIFKWSFNQLVGESQSYDFVVQGVTDEQPMMKKKVDSQTSIIYDGHQLKNGKLYEWDIVNASAFSEYSPLSFAISASGGQSTGSLNGAFRFSTNFTEGSEKR